MNRRYARVEKLETDYKSIHKRLKNAMNGCASMEKAAIEKYIIKILSVNQADHVQTADVSKLLYKRFDDIYPAEIVWVFYTAWNFKAVSGDKPAGKSAKSMHMVYNGDGISGVTINGGWTVIWVGHPLPAPAKWLDVRGWDLRELVDAEKNNYNDREPNDAWCCAPFTQHNRNAYNLQKRMTSNLFSGRVPIFILILTYPPRAATIGTPLIGERINIWQRRIDDITWKFLGILNFFYWEKAIVDFIIF